MSDLISEAFVKAQGEMPIVKFDSANPFFKSKYASLAAIIGETRPILAKHGLAMEQIASISDGHVQVTTKLRHNSGQTLEFGSMMMSIGENGKSEAQAAGSLITYLRRYAWQTALGIAADEDDDGNAAPAKSDLTKLREYVPTEPPAQLVIGKATDKARMEVLHRLQAAPGQPNRDLVTRFLRSKGWVLGSNGEPESWPLCSVPNTPRLLRELSVELAEFEAKEAK